MALQNPAPPGSKTDSRRDEWTSSKLKGSADSRDSSRAFPCISGCRRQVQESQGGFPHFDNGPLCHHLRSHLSLLGPLCCAVDVVVFNPPSLPLSPPLRLLLSLHFHSHFLLRLLTPAASARLRSMLIQSLTPQCFSLQRFTTVLLLATYDSCCPSRPHFLSFHPCPHLVASAPSSSPMTSRSST